MALNKIFGALAVTAGGFKIWIAKIIVGYGFDKILVPVINTLIRKGTLLYDVTDGKIKVKKLREARNDNNQQDYDNSVDDILG